MAFSLSLSLNFNSSISLNFDIPAAKEQAMNNIGNSSIKFGTSSDFTSQAIKDELLTFISAIGSLPNKD